MEENFLTPEERHKRYQEGSFIQILQEQDFNKISKQKGKFTDELFPPNEGSLFSGRSAPRKPIPKFMLVL